MSASTMERAIWRWALLAVVLASAYRLAASRRYEASNIGGQHCTSSTPTLCFAFDRWTGTTLVRAVDIDEAAREMNGSH